MNKMRTNCKSIIYCLMWLSISAIFIACNSFGKNELYSLSIDNNNLYITMPHPTIGIAGINEVSWRGVDLDMVAEDVYNTLKKKHLSDIYSLYVKFEITSTDKYGNEEKNYKKVFLFKVPVEEVRKYKDSKYFGKSYNLSGKLYEAAFGKQNDNKEILDGVNPISVGEQQVDGDTTVAGEVTPNEKSAPRVEKAPTVEDLEKYFK